MEYNVLKSFETNFGYTGDFDMFNDDLIIPGIGQILSFSSLIVPLHNIHDETKIEKQTEIGTVNEQSGAGNGELNPTVSDLSEVAEVSNLDKIEHASTNIEDTTEALNDRKRKQMDPSIYNSFMHPKMFKTHKISLEKPSNVTKNKLFNKDTSTSSKKIKNNVNHKFNLY
jgi:hypothetical protein